MGQRWHTWSPEAASEPGVGGTPLRHSPAPVMIRSCPTGVEPPAQGGWERARRAVLTQSWLHLPVGSSPSSETALGAHLPAEKQRGGTQPQDEEEARADTAGPRSRPSTGRLSCYVPPQHRLHFQGERTDPGISGGWLEVAMEMQDALSTLKLRKKIIKPDGAQSLWCSALALFSLPRLSHGAGHVQGLLFQPCCWWLDFLGAAQSPSSKHWDLASV